MTIETISRHFCHGGDLGYFRHRSAATDSDMRFAVFTPAQVSNGPVPVLYYLAGLTCTEETFVTKACAIQHAARLGIMLVAPDTSPRVELPGDRASWDFGIAAGFYLDATQAPWSKHYRMYSYVVNELPTVIAANFRADLKRSGIFGHSMGGHGALTIALKNPEKYRSVSAFSPICAPTQVPWGHKAFTGYLGENRATWPEYDACALLASGRRHPETLFVDQGTSDKFLRDQLKPELLEEACKAAGQPLELRMHIGYDHGYFFIQTFIADHLAWHARRLGVTQ
jgi:S-formylglutathione hydrolase